MDIARYTHADSAECTALIEYNGREEVIVPHGIRDIVCDEEFQAQCEEPVEIRRKRRSIHNTLNYCLKKKLFSNQELTNQLKTIKREKKSLRQTHLNIQICQDLVKEFNTFERVQHLEVKFIEIRLHGA